MKAILWKELRENLKWAILAMIGLALAEIYGLYYVPELSGGDPNIACLLKGTYLMATTFGCALVGLILGFLQVLPEQGRDRWAALLHRPVSRSVIFCGKAVAGVILYAIATVPPFLLTLWLVATPGHFVAPFVPGTMWGVLIDMSAGLVYYFAALVVALQRGSWFGARVLAPFASVHLSLYLPTYEDSAIHILNWTVFYGVLMFLAAWGAMLSNGSFRERPWLSKAALLLVVFFGLCGVGDLTKILLNMGVSGNGGAGAQYKFTLDGTPLIVTENANLTETVTDLQGHEVTDERYKGSLANENFYFINQVSYLIGDPHGLDFKKRWPSYRSIWSYFSMVRMEDGLPHPTQWFYLSSAKYFEGISVLNRMPVKMADRSGFKPWGAAPEPFQFEDNWNEGGGGDSPTLVNEGRTVYVIDLIHETMSQLPNPDHERIYFARKITMRTERPGVYDTAFVLATGKELRVFDAKQNLVATLPYHQDVDRLGMIDIGVNLARDRYFVQYAASNWIDWSERHLIASQYEIVDPQGNVIQSYTLPALPNIPPAPTWTTYIADRVQTPLFWYGTVAYQRLGIALGFHHYDDRGYNANYPYRSHPNWKGFNLLVVSLVLAPVALLWARWRHFSWASAISWALFVFAFNIAGLIAFRLVADWPVLIPCPKCSRKRPIDKDECPYCHSGWPAPTRSGIEIFDTHNFDAVDSSLEPATTKK